MSSSNPSPKAVVAASTATASMKSALVASPRKARTAKKGGSSFKSPANKNHHCNGSQFDDTSRRVLIALFIMLYLCGAFAFCIQVFVSPSKLLGGLANVQNQNHAVVFPQVATTSPTSNNNRFQINPSTIQSLQGLTDQQIRDLLGNEVQIQLMDQHGRIIQTTAKVDVQTSTTSTASIDNNSNNKRHDVTVNFDIYNGVAAFHCNTATTVAAPANDVILLNARRYLSPDHFNETMRPTIPKDKYHEKVFLDLCMHARDSGVITSVTALDVSSAIHPHRLLSILKQLHQRHRIQRLPVAAMITPGQSANVVVDWLLYGDDARILQNQITERWIPVASESVLELNDNDDESFVDEITENASAPLRNGALELVRGWPVLAVYGSDDILARLGAELLERDIQAQTMALAGGDDCHEKAPDTFATAVVQYLSKEIKKSSPTGTSMTRIATNGKHLSFTIQLDTV